MSFGKKGLAAAGITGTRMAPVDGARSPRVAPAPSAMLGAPAKWARLPAALIDGGLGLVLPLLAVAMTDLALGLDLEGITAFFLACLASLAYHVGFETSSWRATPGKKALGLVVTTADGGPIGVGRSVLRNTLGKAVSGFSPFYLGYSCVLFTKEARAAHDFVAGTRVRSARTADDVAAAFV